MKSIIFLDMDLVENMVYIYTSHVGYSNSLSKLEHTGIHSGVYVVCF